MQGAAALPAASGLQTAATASSFSQNNIRGGSYGCFEASRCGAGDSDVSPVLVVIGFLLVFFHLAAVYCSRASGSPNKE